MCFVRTKVERSSFNLKSSHCQGEDIGKWTQSERQSPLETWKSLVITDMQLLMYRWINLLTPALARMKVMPVIYLCVLKSVSSAVWFCARFISKRVTTVAVKFKMVIILSHKRPTWTRVLMRITRPLVPKIILTLRVCQGSLLCQYGGRANVFQHNYALLGDGKSPICR